MHAYSATSSSQTFLISRVAVVLSLSTLYLLNLDFSSKRNFPLFCHWTLSLGLFSLHDSFTSLPLDAAITSGSFASAGVSEALSSMWILSWTFSVTQAYSATSSLQTLPMTRATLAPSLSKLYLVYLALSLSLSKYF